MAYFQLGFRGILPVVLLCLCAGWSQAGGAAELEKLRLGLQNPNVKERVSAIQKWNGLAADAGKAADLLLRALADQAPPVRLAAEQAMVKIGEKAVPALALALQSGDKNVRKHGLNAVDKLGPKAKLAAPALVRMLESQDANIRNEARRVLVKIGPDAVPALLAIFKGNDAQRKLGAEVVRQIGAQHALPHLLQLAKDKDAGQRRLGVSGLEALGPDAKSAVDVLAGLLGDNDAEVRNRAMMALIRLGPDATANLTDFLTATPDLQLWTTAVTQLLRAGRQGQTLPPAVAKAIAKRLDHKDAQIRLTALNVLQPYPQRSRELAPAVIPLLADPEGNVRNMAGNILNGMQVAILPELLKQLKHPREDVRASTLTFLNRYAYKTKEMIPDLAPLLGDKNARTRQTAAEMLWHSQSPDALWPLAGALTDEKTEVRRAAAQSLAQLAYLNVPATSPARDKGLANATKALTDADPLVRNAALNFLKKSGQAEVPVLLALLKSNDVQAQIAAANLLGAHGKSGKEAIPPLTQAAKSDNAQLRLAGLNALVKFLPEAAPAFKELFADKRFAVRLATAQALQKSGAPSKVSALDFLVTAMKQDTDPSVRVAAAEAVQRIGPEAAPALIKLLHEPQTRELAIRALTNLSGDKQTIVPLLADAARGGEAGAVVALARFGKAAVPAFLELTGHKNQAVRVAAIDGLGEMRPFPKEAIPHLKKLLGDGHPEIKAAAMRLMTRIDVVGPEGKEFLLQAIHDKDLHTRRAAGQALARMRGQAVPALIDVVEKSLNQEARGTAIFALGSIGSGTTAGVKVLVDVVRSTKAEDQPLKVHALAALDRMYPEAEAPLLAILIDGEDSAQLAVLAALKPEQLKLGKELVINLLRSKNAEVRLAAGKALARLGDGILMELQPLLADKDGDVRAAALLAVENLEAVETLGKLLRDDKLAVREAASRALAKRGGDAHGVLAEALRSKDFRVQVAAADAIVPVEERADKLVPLLVDILLAKGARDLEMQAAARAIQRVNPMLGVRLLGGQADVPVLLELLKKQPAEVREMACLALAERGPAAAEALPAVAALLKQQKIDAAVLAAAAKAVNSLSPRQKDQQEDTAHRLAPDLVERLVKATHEKSMAVREQVMSAAQAQFSAHGGNSSETVLSALYLGQVTEEANNWLAYHASTTSTSDHTSPNVVRMLALFHPRNKDLAGRLSPAAQQALTDNLWRFLEEHGARIRPRPIAEVKITLPIEQLLSSTSLYLALDVLKDDPAYKDRMIQGQTLQELHQAWTLWWREWARERAMQGLWSEMGLPDHQMQIWPCLLNMHDLASDAVVKQRFKMLLDLTAIEEEQISIQGIRSGRRGQQDAVGCGLDPWKDVLYGDHPRAFHASGARASRVSAGSPGAFSGIIWTTSYKMPAAAILLRKLNRPVSHYAINNHHFYHGSVFGYASPYYVLGCQLSQPVGTMEFFGTWHRLVFDDQNAIFFPLPKGERRHVLHDNVYITTWAGNQTRQSIRFTSDLKTVERPGWIFLSNGPAYAAIHVENGYDLEKVEAKQRGRQTCDVIHLKEPRSFTVLHAGDVSKFGSFEKFQEAILKAPLKMGPASVQYSGPQTQPIEFFRAAGKPPQIAGVAVVPGGKMIYDSPYLRGVAGQAQITVRVGLYSAVYDFEKNVVTENTEKMGRSK